MTTKKKILFFIRVLDNLPGGAERVLCTVASGLAARGYEVEILSCDKPGGQPFYPLDPRIKRIYVSPMRVKWGIGIICYLLDIRRIILSGRPDIVIGFMHTAYIPLSWASSFINIPAIASEHISFDHYRGRFFQFLAILFSMPFLSAMTAQSRRIISGYPWLLQHKMHVVPNPVDMIEDSIQKKEIVEKEDQILLNIGRLTPQKDQMTLIRAFDLIAEKFPNWQFHIYGEGVLKSLIQETINQTKVSSRIRLFDPVRDVSNIYKKADIFVNPALYESFGLVNAEAMAHHLPVVGFADCPGTNELIIDGQNGILVSGENRVLALAQVLEKLMKNPDLRMRLGQKGPQSIQQYNPNSVIQSWENLIKRFSQ